MHKVILALLLFFLGLASRADADPPRLAYLIEGLGNAQSAEVVAPGADGTGHAFRLRHALGSWSRFNWPLFDPVSDCRELEFRARRAAADPPSLVVRILTEDGNQWQGPRLELSDSWQAFRLTAADFRFFRGSSAGPAAPFDLNRAMQFQVVPTTTAGPGVGEFLVDDIRLLPDGPSWHVEGDELRPPIDPLREQWQRADDLVRRWEAEAARLVREARGADLWLAELETLIAAGTDPQQLEQAHGRLANASLPWQQAPHSPPPLDDMPGVEWDAFGERVAAGQTPPATLVELHPEMPLRQSRLYKALPQPDPEAVSIDGMTRVRHRLRFSDGDVQQAVFTVLPLPEPLDLQGQRILMRMRCTATSLNAELPLVLRLFTESEESGESWGDLTPQPLPGAEWTEVVFDVARPLRGTRFTPSRTRSLAVRMENTPGSGTEFVLELADIRVAPPEPIATARRQLLRAVETRVEAARSELYARRDRIARLEDDLREIPELRRAYLSSFETPLARDSRDAPKPETSPLDDLTLPPVCLRPTEVRTGTITVDGRPALRLEVADQPAGSEILAELRDRTGRLQAAARGPAGELTLVPASAPAWSPGEPHVYRLRCLIRLGEQIRSYSERLVGLRTADVRAGGPDALLRHTRLRRQPDWTYRLNGRCFFPRVAAYYENYLLEFAARGYLHCGDDVRLELCEDEFFDSDGRRRHAWRDLSAVILDTERALESGEVDLVRRLTRQGANLIISAPCYTANPTLAEFLEAQLEPAGTLAQPIGLAAELTQPVPVKDLGSVDVDVIARFQPELATASGLRVFAVQVDKGRTLAMAADGRAIIVQRPYGEGRVTLMGTSLGAAIHVHQRVTRSGSTHRLYDRDTACGLERLSRVVVNLSRTGCPSEQHRPRLYLEMTPERTWVAPGEPLRLTVQLIDVHGNPVAGQLRSRVRTVAMHATGGGRSELADLTATAPGRYEILCVPENETGLESRSAASEQDASHTAAPTNVLTYPAPAPAVSPRVLSLHFKGFAADFIPADGAIAVLLAPPASAGGRVRIDHPQPTDVE